MGKGIIDSTNKVQKIIIDKIINLFYLYRQNPSLLENKMKTTHIAVCGMNCVLCMGYQRTKNHCDGCNARNNSQPFSCRKCSINLCEQLKKSKVKFCFVCSKYPCTRLKNLDKRYRTKYGMSMIENLNNIKENGVRNFVKQEKARWACPKCGSIICVHRKQCVVCGEERKK